MREKVEISALWLLIIIQLLLVFCIFFYFTLSFYQELSHQSKEPLKAAKPVKCRDNDIKCVEKHAANLANQIEGKEIAFASRQCGALHPCPTPNSAKITADTALIRAFAKDPSISVIPVNGTNSLGFIYYCTREGKCWKLNSKINKVVGEIK